ncbi:MAG: hypothetical protein OEY40_03230 [Candidatus Bathyarchaeota archaeon]|nr:hypothetical protein [Candidatus Bathyarchaeota archaeon]
MTSLEIVTLLLGIIGTVTGVFSTFLHYWKTRKEKPILNVEVLECRHYCHEKECQLGIEFLVKNTGDRDTTGTILETSFTDRGKKYKQLNYLEICIVKAHMSIRVRELFSFPNVPMNERCTFKLKLHHTHGVFPFQAESTKSDKDLSGWGRKIIF